jgi:hypothetical protein
MTRFNEVKGRVEFTSQDEAHAWAKIHGRENIHPFQFWKVELDAELKRFFVAVYSKNTRKLNGYAS